MTPEELDDLDPIDTVDLASERQVGFLYDLMQDKDVDEAEALAEVEQWFGSGDWSDAGSVEFLTKEEASWLIEELKGRRSWNRR